ncbi:hybrid signal transduction histidine kinase A isoform X4 [Glossina fuscipes]|uniref:Hybrid signal transduction histidine kinase A isoform X2 n=1 Tax=Glossina fuscipes TaxID=7396 RepID=A0A8U0WGI7_9MUSC|nr:hybrid signal transduction histidine kinase A isoform X2 [Glossina fuscipes]XP_037884292.1 hybrid signal transduction histidine kinase A isoform X3 [Glossina fuscipes]XP_037884293.1 hybrid signal transduction histidine kinase A isoform X4 [Glossina fuscipes]
MRSNTNVFCGSDNNNNNNNAYHGSNTIKNIHTSGQKLQTSINNLGVGHQLQIGNNYGYQHPMLPHPQHTQPNLPPPPPPSATHPSLWAAQAPRNPTCYPQPGCMPSNAHLNTTTYQGRQFQGRGFPYPCNFSGQPCERINLSAPNYAKLPPLSVVNQQRINDCAGIPLISTAVAHLTPNQRQRISRKQSHSPPPRNWANLLPAGVHSHNYCNQLVAHAQGPPLLLNKQQHLTIGQQQQQQQGNQPPNHWNPSNCYTMHGGYSQQQQFTAKCQMPQAKQDIIRSPLRYQNSAPAALTNCKSNEILAKIDCSDIKNAENINNGDACLPRIIKPRKRRKKDRKPNNLVNGLFLKMENQIKTAEKQSNPAEADILKCLNHFTNIYSNSTEECTTRHKQKNIKNIYTEQQQASDENKFIKNHGICFCVECDPLRSIWEHPLRRSPSDSSESSSTSSSSNATTTSSNDSKSAQDEPRCRLIEKQKSESNLNAWPKSRADIVGVIGSNRISHEHNAALTQTYAGGTQESNGGYANILSGINLANDLFSRTASTHTLNHNILTIMPNNNKHNSELIDADADADAMVLLPETAETLLTRSINEISQKLIETCSNEFGDLLNSSSTSSCGSSSSSSGSSGISDFSNDSGIDSAHINCDDLVFNFDQLHIPGNSSTLTSTSISTSTSTSTSTSACNNLTSARATTSITPTATNKYAAQSFLTTLPTITTLTSSGNQSNNKLLTPTLELLVDFNNNQQQQQHQSARMPQSLKQKLILNDNHWQQQHQHQQQCNELQSFQRPEQQQQQQQQHQFFSNCYDLLWHQKHQHHHHQQQQ